MLGSSLAIAAALAVWLGGLAAGGRAAASEEVPPPQTWQPDKTVAPRCYQPPRKVLIGTEISGWDLVLSYPL